MKDGKLQGRNRDLTGQTFGMLTAVAPHHSDGKKLSWAFQCLCGRTCVKRGGHVVYEATRRGGVPNCGCVTRHLQSKPKTHGMSRHPAYAVWRSMNDRCRLPTHQAWKNYGARGIEVCDAWQGSFEAFWADMGATYQPGLSLDRLDNSLGYGPENCEWRGTIAQANNRRSNTIIDTPWGALTVAEASRLSGVKNTTLHFRLKMRWPLENLFKPAGWKSTTS